MDQTVFTGLIQALSLLKEKIMSIKNQETNLPKTHLKVNQIVQGLNPRRYFDEKEMAELESSVAAQGILQPILVRPLQDGTFQIVAGERRWRSAKKVHGEDYEIPVHIREMTDEQATAASASENIDRAQMSPAEEAEVAAKILAQHKGDHEEAAKRLGWARGTFDKRLSLMQCSQAVRDALTEKKISLGHAELLATVTKEKQDKALANILSLPNLPLVQEFKKQLEQISKNLAGAIFVKDECAGCQYNSTNQSQLFAEAISEGHCTNGSCYDTKTEAELVIRQESLKDEYPTVKILRVGENFTQIKIVAEGATGVGQEQSIACRSCANYGAVVSSLPDSIGKVYRNQCFDTACNSNKVAERIKAEKAVEEETQPKAETKTSGQDKTKIKSETGDQVEATPKVTVTDTTRVKEYRVKVWRKILTKELFGNEQKNQAVLLALGLCNLARHIDGSKLKKAFTTLTKSEVENGTEKLGEVASLLLTTDDAVKASLHKALAASIEDKIEERELRQLLTFLDVDMAKHWQLNKEYLETMTKSEIDVVLDEIGLKAFIGKDYSKLMNGKKDEIIKSVLEVADFDYQGKIPKVMFY
jgi:ParB family chromosome partitioning protein